MLRRIDCVYHPTLGLRVIKKKKMQGDFVYPLTLGLRVMKKMQGRAPAVDVGESPRAETICHGVAMEANLTPKRS